MSLFDVAAEYRDSFERLADLDLDEATLRDTLEGMSGELEAKATNVALFARSLESLAASIKDAEAAMAKRRKALEARSERLRTYMLDCMQLAGVQRIESPHLQISVKKTPPSVDVFDAAQLPADYLRQPEVPPPAPDKAAIRDALKSGMDVPGARLVSGVRIDIR